MTREINKLFVYGTLLQGEIRNHYMNDCELIQAFEIPGKLYDTGKEYPAALFDGDPKETVCGEIYRICNDGNEKLEELDEVEGTGLDLYRRRELRYKRKRLYTYEAGEALSSSLKEVNKIESGSWRRYGSLALKNPIEFALNFENAQKKRYKRFPPEDSSGLIFLRCSIPILVTASHATAHVRMKMYKEQEEYTGAISALLHSLTGTHALYTHFASAADPNFYDDAPFKKKLEKIVKNFGIRLVLDLHGTRRDWSKDIYPGVGRSGEFLLGNNLYFSEFEKSARSNDLTLGGIHIFPASRQMTIAKFAAMNLGTPAIQVEINDRLRHPESSPSEFERMIRFLYQFITNVKTLI